MSTNFLNDNENRDYPLLAETTGATGTLSGDNSLRYLPHAAVVDFGCILGIGITYDATVDKVYLHRVRRFGDTFEFDVRCTAAGLEQYRLVFERQLTDDRFAVQHVEAELIDELSNGSEQSDGCQGDVWTGYLVTGNLSVLSTMAEGQAFGTESQQFEPVTVRSLAGAFVRSINLANVDRQRATPPAGCRPFCWPFEVGQTRKVVSCLDGHIRLIAGYNCEISQDRFNNVLEISAALGGGAGEPCGETALFEGEEPYPQSSLLTGGPACNETVRSLNGRGGPVLSITGGTGVTVAASRTKAHTVDVLVDLNDLALCYDPVEASDCPGISDSPDPCECGAE